MGTNVWVVFSVIFGMVWGLSCACSDECLRANDGEKRYDDESGCGGG